MNAHAQDPDDDVHLNEGQNDVDDVYLTDPGPARCNGDGPDPDPDLLH
jgi:hypothetical protein